jgi:ketosteroid isomerase-like protein
MPTDLEARIDALESRAAIDELRSRYAWHAMRGDAAGVASLFTEDCVFDGPAGPGNRTVINGRAAFAAFLAPSIGKIGAVLPLIHNGIIDVKGDHATGSCVMETPMAPDFGHLVGDYVEEFARIDGKWYFAVRRMYLRVPYREEYPD